MWELPHHLDEERVHPGVTGQLRVERRGEQVTLPDGDDPTGGRSALDACEHLDAGADLLDPRAPG